MRLLYFFLLANAFISCSSNKSSDDKNEISETLTTSSQKKSKLTYTPKEIMDNLAWQWRDHYDEMFKAMGLTKDPGFKIIYDHQSHNPSVQGMYGDYVMDNGLNSFLS